jgi:hypothetical protein
VHCNVKVLNAKIHTGFDSLWFQWDFPMILSLSSWQQYGPGDDKTCNRNEYQKYLLGGKGDLYLRLTIIPSSCVGVLKYGNLNLLEISGTLQVFIGIKIIYQFPNIRIS